ncbi:MAG: glycerol kinase, partial [Clostridiaceae bacterium]|nr:glycerol kinase [Clostridiaceae bacterium]
MAAKYLLAIDAGTTSNRVALLDKEGSILRMVQQELHQSFPHDGWVEEDGMEIWQIVLELIREIMRTADLQDSDIAAIGMANQRETTLVWSRESGKPVYPAIVWQCRRT